MRHIRTPTHLWCARSRAWIHKGASGRRSPTLELVPPCLNGDSLICSDDGASLTQRDANGCPDGDGRDSSREGEDVVMEPWADGLCEFLVIVEKQKKRWFCDMGNWVWGKGGRSICDIQITSLGWLSISRVRCHHIDVITATHALTASNRIHPVFRPTFGRNPSEV